MRTTPTKKVLVLGGGAAGQRAAVDLIQAGAEVVLVEPGDTIGGTMMQLGTMFPRHNCLLCRGDEEHGKGCTRPGISTLLLDYTKPAVLDIRTRSRLVRAEPAENGTYKVTIRTDPRFIIPGKCILCGRCSEACPQTLPDTYQAGLSLRKAVYLPAERCVPESYALIRGDYCRDCGKCAEVCPTNAVDLKQEEKVDTYTADAVVLATGMRLYDAALSGEYGYGRFPNVVSGLEMERMTSPAGPGEGSPLRPGDGKTPEKIAWLQCIGSRDEDHDYCSSFCCGYASRQAVLAKQLLPDTEMRIFMMDDRVFARNFSKTYDPLREEYEIGLEHCRVSVLRQEDETKDLILQITGEDGKVREEKFGMVVLSIGGTGSMPQQELKNQLGLEADGFGFVRTGTLTPLDTNRPGIFAAGSVSGPADLSDSVTGGSAAAARVCSYLGIGMENRTGREKQNSASVGSAAEMPEGAGVGVFVCDCAGEIGDTINLEKVAEELNGANYSGRMEVVPYGCLPEGLEAMRNSLQNHGYKRAVIGSCKRRTYSPLFERELPVPVEFVSLREECAYVHRGDPDGASRKTLMLLRDGVKMAAARGTAENRGMAELKDSQDVLVIGGGLAGLTASLHIADSGAVVHLVEREKKLGGHALKLDRSPEGDDIRKYVREMVVRAERHPLIHVYKQSEVERQLSSRGNITASIRTAGEAAGEERIMTAGAVLVSSGGEEYRGPVFGLGSSKRVITLLDYGMQLRKKPALVSEIQEAAFIGCVGPWNEAGSAESWRCSRNCCETMVRQAKRLREENPCCRVTVLVREVNTYSFKEEDYTAARKAGVLFVRYEPDNEPVFTETEKGPCLLVYDKHAGETLEFHPDLLVLSAAVMPRKDALQVSDILGVPLDEDGFFKEWESKTRSYSALEPNVSVGGLAHGPKPVREVVAQALAAAQNTLGNLKIKNVVDTGKVAEVSSGDCTSCLTCVRSCPYSVPKIGCLEYPGNSKQGRAVIDIFRCQGCGACVSECPAGAISLEDYSDKVMLESGILGSPALTVISCRYCGNIPVELAGTGRYQYPADVKIVEVPCTGFITHRHILSALEQGSKGVLVHACPAGSCHHLTGNIRAEKRIGNIRGLLKAAGMQPERVRFADLGIGHGETFAELVTAFSEELKEVS